MQKGEVQTSILKGWEVVERLGIAETISNPSPLPINDEFRDIILRGDASYLEIYMCGLRLSHYNFLLTDYSYFQFSWSKENCVRYAYYPNPYLTGREGTGGISTIKRWHELLEAELLSFEEYLALLKDSKPEVRVPLIRYENAPDDYVALEHPCSHFHIGHHGSNRWASNRVLTPNAFTLLLCKLYYSHAWQEHWEDKDGKRFNRFEELLTVEKQKSNRLGEAHFAESELKSFHLA